MVKFSRFWAAGSAVERRPDKTKVHGSTPWQPTKERVPAQRVVDKGKAVC